MRSIAPPGTEGEQPRVINYVYDAAAERAKELDRIEKEKEEKERMKRRMELRQSMMQTSAISSKALSEAAKPPAKVAS